MATREYTGEEVKQAVVSFLTSQAGLWRNDAKIEGLRAAGNRETVSTLNWGADRLDSLAGQIKNLALSVDEPEVEEFEPNRDLPVEFKNDNFPALGDDELKNDNELSPVDEALSEASEEDETVADEDEVTETPARKTRRSR